MFNPRILRNITIIEVDGIKGKALFNKLLIILFLSIPADEGALPPHDTETTDPDKAYPLDGCILFKTFMLIILLLASQPIQNVSMYLDCLLGVFNEKQLP